MIERLDALFASGECPDAIVVLVDAWTSLRRLAVPRTPPVPGRYLDYLCDEVVAFVDERYPTLADRDHRGLTGKSSGGYGAMVVPMLRPDVFGALASHAGDALFESCYLPEFPEPRAAAARRVRRLLGDVLRARWRRRPAELGVGPRCSRRTGTPPRYSPDPASPGGR